MSQCMWLDKDQQEGYHVLLPHVHANQKTRPSAEQLAIFLTLNHPKPYTQMLEIRGCDGFAA